MDDRCWTTKHFAAILGIPVPSLHFYKRIGVFTTPQKRVNPENSAWACWGREHIEDYQQYKAGRKEKILLNKQPKRTMGPYYTIEDLTAAFGISRWAIYNWRKKGAMPRPYGGRRFAWYGPEHWEAISNLMERMEQRRSLCLLPNSAVDRRTQRQNISNTIRAKVWEQCEGRCVYCQAAINPFLNFHVDHVIPVSRGGTNSLENLVGSCSTCNLSKGAKEEFAPSL